VTIFLIQLVFLIRDNLASRLALGSVTTLTYAWMLQQVPETLIGTAIGTALLPTLSELAASERLEEFHQTVQKAVKVLLALCLPIAAILAVGFRPLLSVVFGFGKDGTQLLVLATAAFLGGLLGHSLKEVGARAFYARQNALIPMMTAGINVVLYILLGSLLYRPLGVAGIALTDSIVFTFEALLLLWLQGRKLQHAFRAGSTLWRALLAAAVGGFITWGALTVLEPRTHVLVAGTLPMLLGLAFSLPILSKEVKILSIYNMNLFPWILSTL